MNAHDLIHRRDLFVSAGSLLFGQEWQRPIARMLGPFHPEGGRGPIDDRLVRRWAAGERTIPDWVITALQRATTSRAAELGAMGGRLARGGAAQASFATLGFFSPEIDELRHAIRRSEQCAPWFTLAQDLSRFALEILSDHQVPLDDRQRLSISALFVRAHQSCQAAVILAETAMIGDARTVLRSAAEHAIALVAVAADPTFVDRLVAAHRKHQLTTARILLEDVDCRPNLTEEQVKKLDATKREIEDLKGQPDQEPRPINWADVARQHCKDLYNLIYRPLSVDGTHSTVDSMNRHFEADAQLNITAVRVAPDVSDTAEIIDALSSACLIFLWAVEPFVRSFERGGDADRVQQYLARFRELEPNIGVGI
jgi:Family of unknown function (DUF5677)